MREGAAGAHLAHLQSQLDMICGWLSHLDQRLRVVERLVREGVRAEVGVPD